MVGGPVEKEASGEEFRRAGCRKRSRDFSFRLDKIRKQRRKNDETID